MNIAFLPSPTVNAWHLGFFTFRAYALCLVIGIVVAMFITDRRYVARGGTAGQIADVALWAVPFGIMGARLYHVFTTPGPYFGADGHLINIVKVWNGGLGIWGALLGGAVGAYIGCRQTKIPFLVLADCLAPALAVAQAIGRWGNWFNNELYGRATTLPWGLSIYEINPATGRAQLKADGQLKSVGTFHPTFLYESLWCVIVAYVVWEIGRRFKHLATGSLFAIYVMLYTAGRAGIESLRVDDAVLIGGLRLNVWTSILCFLLALGWFEVTNRRRNRQESEQTTSSLQA